MFCEKPNQSFEKKASYSLIDNSAFGHLMFYIILS